MKNRKLMPFITTVAVLASCDAQNYVETLSPNDDFGQTAMVALSVKDVSGTKASGLSSATEKSISDVQVFVFREDGVLDAYQASQGNAVRLKTTSGLKRLYVLANAPSLEDVISESALMSRTSRLSDNTIGHFVMTSGTTTVNLSPGDNNVSVVVQRIASKVEIAKITNAMGSVQYQEKEFKVLAAYLTNVASGTSYDLSAAPQDYYNKMAYQSSEVDGLVYDNYSGGQQIELNNSINDSHYLYAYPNPSEDKDTNAGVWSPRATKLVVKASIGGVVYYYPVVLPAPMLSNKSYRIDEFKITRPGSIDQDTPVSFADCSVTISVSDWNESSLGNLEI